MTREEILSQYKTDDSGVIQDLGKFEREMLYVPYFWDSGMNGFTDEDVNRVWFFVISPEDVKEFPELAGEYGIAIEETDTGFVCGTLFGTEDVYRQAVARMEQQESELPEMD